MIDTLTALYVRCTDPCSTSFGDLNQTRLDALKRVMNGAADAADWETILNLLLDDQSTGILLQAERDALLAEYNGVRK